MALFILYTPMESVMEFTQVNKVIVTGLKAPKWFHIGSRCRLDVMLVADV